MKKKKALSSMGANYSSYLAKVRARRPRPQAMPRVFQATPLWGPNLSRHLNDLPAVPLRTALPYQAMSTQGQTYQDIFLPCQATSIPGHAHRVPPT